MAAHLTRPAAARVAIIGGGCAGLAAAARLAAKGVALTLYEASPHWGGRARRVMWKGLGLDNGQHILLGAYRDTLALLRQADVDIEQALMRTPLQLTMHARFQLKACAALPAPLHILAGLLTARGLDWRARLSAARFMLWLRITGFRLAQDMPLAELLARRSQPENVIRWLWEPLCLAALNTPLAEASAQVFLNVLRDSFARSKSDSDLLLPRLDLSALLADPVAAYIARQGGQLRLACAVHAIAPEVDGYRVTSDAGDECFSHVIVAAHPARIPPLLAAWPAMASLASRLSAMRHQPIYTVYVQYAASARLPAAMLGLTGGHGQWVFDRGQLYEQPGLMAVVISAEGAHQHLRQEALAQTIIRELASHFPALPSPLWHKVIAEKRATFACSTGLERPPAITPEAGLLLAGDYVAGDYPATIEGAVRSGFFCADHILARFPTSTPQRGHPS